MKERVVTLGLALGAFVLFYALFIPKPANEVDAPALPVSTEARGAGYQALWRWLRSQGVQVLSLRERYDGLDHHRMPHTGNVLIATLPQKLPARPDETEQLEAWLARGNTLVVMAAMDDTPAWAARTTAEFETTLTRITGLKFNVVRNVASTDSKDQAASTSQSLRRALQMLTEPQRGSILPKGAHPLFAGVKSVETHSELPASRWTARSADDTVALELGERSDRAEGSIAPEAAVWLKRSGQGQVIVLAFASPFSNDLIGKQDNARLFANIVGWSRGDGGMVMFDDAHQGLVSYYDAKAFFSDPRLHRTLLWICGFWLLLVLGWQRIRPQTDGWNPVDVTTFIKVTGGFLAGKVAANLVGQRLCANFFNSIRHRLALPQNGEPVWGWLDMQASIPQPELRNLRRLHARTQTRQRIDLIQLQNCLTAITRNLL